MFEKQQKVKVDNNHKGEILRVHPDRTSCLVQFNGESKWVQNSRITLIQQAGSANSNQITKPDMDEEPEEDSGMESQGE